ncbi:MAG: hypothetical protein KME46_26565 [Brasilonema angustatum HA4187-MV1]|jgi:hypothetical protein|nr:hypothetical protein [Brasilonema angustatum HA4187-MV1]
MYEAFIDLDELIVRCRDKQAKKFIKEAVACYRAGAYRSCIVATWNAVVFDFLHKLRELELLEDKEASKLLEQFEKLSSEKKFKELWQFESDIPKKALNPFELISTVEMSDIERLFEDRSRCAHPSMTSLEEPFEATAELARYHLRSAITHLLERPPVQGRAARERIFQYINSEYFPTDSELAIKYFQKSPLARARLALIKDVVIGLTISLLTEDLPEDEKARQFSAIHAISSMYPEQTREILNDKMSDIILNKVVDTNWDKVIIYLGKVKIWDSITEPCQLKAIAFIEKLKIFERKWFEFNESPSSDSLDILSMATRIGFLKQTIDTKLQLPLEELLSLKKNCQYQLQYNSINEIIKPLLEKFIPKATFNELISMRSEGDCSLNDKIKPYLMEKIKEASLEEILDGLSQIIQEDKLLYESFEQRLLFLLENTSLEQLLEARKYYLYSSSCTKVSTVISRLNESVIKFLERLEFNDLLSVKYEYRQQFFEDFLKDILKPIFQNNKLEIVRRFVSSNSFSDSEFYAKLLIEITDNLSNEQWKYILKVFFENHYIHNSFFCARIFESLFKKSITLNVCIQADWRSFRENLDDFSTIKKNLKDINRLKQVIDTYLPVE